MWKVLQHCIQSIVIVGSDLGYECIGHYRGFLLLQQENKTWLVRPERSPMHCLPFRTNASSLEQVKTIIDNRLCDKKRQMILDIDNHAA